MQNSSVRELLAVIGFIGACVILTPIMMIYGAMLIDNFYPNIELSTNIALILIALGLCPWVIFILSMVRYVRKNKSG